LANYILLAFNNTSFWYAQKIRILVSDLGRVAVKGFKEAVNKED